MGVLSGPGLLLALALPAAAPLPTSPSDLATVQARLFAGDVVTLARARQAQRARSVDVDVGPWGLLDDLSRVMRCLPLGPVPAREAPRFRAAREVARLERVRLQRRLLDGVFAGPALEALLGRSWIRADLAAQPELVRWPASSERWPDEVGDPIPAPSRCPNRLDGARDRGAGARVRAAARGRAVRGQLARLVPLLDELPDGTASHLAYAYLVDAASAPDDFSPSPAWLGRLERALLRDRGPHRLEGLLALAEVGGRRAPAEAQRVLFALLEEPDLDPDRDSRARARLVATLEPDWGAVVRVVEGAERPRAVDRPVLDNALARARFALRDRAGLMRLGRRFVQREVRGPFDEQTRDLLLLLAFELPVPEALAWIDEVVPKDPRSREARLASLGRWGLARGAVALAAALFDRLRLQAEAEVATRGPKAEAALARWVGLRAEAAYEAEDPAGFGGLVAELVAMADRVRGRPLARHAPHRAVATLGQTLTGRLVERGQDRAQAEMAAHLLEAVTALSADRGRWRQPLRALVPGLAQVAGPLAKGRRPPPDPKKRRRRGPPVRQLGEVVVTRLPPALEPPDAPTPQPRIDSFLVHLGPEGGLVSGAPWGPKR